MLGVDGVRRVFAVRRTLLPLAAPYLGVACLALLALLGSYALTSELDGLAHASAGHAAATGQLIASAPARRGISATRSAPARILSTAQRFLAAWQQQAPAAHRAAITARNEPSAVGASQSRHLLVAVALARAH
jgi:hypothetical protein